MRTIRSYDTRRHKLESLQLSSDSSNIPSNMILPCNCVRHTCTKFIYMMTTFTDQKVTISQLRQFRYRQTIDTHTIVIVVLSLYDILDIITACKFPLTKHFRNLTTNVLASVGVSILWNVVSTFITKPRNFHFSTIYDPDDLRQ